MVNLCGSVGGGRVRKHTRNPMRPTAMWVSLLALLIVGALPADDVSGKGVQRSAADRRCAAKDRAIVQLGKHDGGDPSALMSLLATAIQTCGANDSDLFLAMGSVLYGAGDSAGALRSWRIAWRLNPLSVGLANNVAAALIDLARPRDAIATLRVLESRHAHATATHEDAWKTDINMASALAETGDWRRSARRLERALAHPTLSPSHPQWPLAAANLIYARRRLCEWLHFSEDTALAAALVRRQLTGGFDSLRPAAMPVDPFMALAFLTSHATDSYRAAPAASPAQRDLPVQVGPAEVLAATRRYASAWHVDEASLMHLVGGTVLQGEDLWGAGGRGVGASGVGWGARGVWGRRKVGVGYVCSEFGRRHSVMLLMRGVFAGHDASRLRVVCLATYSGARADNAERAAHGSEAVGGAEEGRDEAKGEVDARGGWGIGLTEGCAEIVTLRGGGEESQATAVNAHELHVLVDLNGWTSGHAMGVLAYRPAPIIINFMGFAGSTGTSFVDYAAFDRVVAPPDHRWHFTEHLLLLPSSYFVTDFLRTEFSAPAARPAREPAEGGALTEVEMQGGGWGSEDERLRANEGLAADSVLVCNHDQGYKIDPHRFASWVRIMQFDPSSAHGAGRGGSGPSVEHEQGAGGMRAEVGSGVGGVVGRRRKQEESRGQAQLWLLEQDGGVAAALRASAPAHVSDRMVFSGKVSVQAHVRRIRMCDVALDTAAVGAHTTAANYLWARVPVVTLPGPHVMSRVAASLQRALADDVKRVGAGSDQDRDQDRDGTGMGKTALGFHSGSCADLAIARTEEDYVELARALLRGAAGDKHMQRADGEQGDAVSGERGRADGRGRGGVKRGSVEMFRRLRACLGAATELLVPRARAACCHGGVDARAGEEGCLVEVGPRSEVLRREPGDTLGAGHRKGSTKAPRAPTSPPVSPITTPHGSRAEARVGGHTRAARVHAVFDTERWVRDWERALLVTIELLLCASREAGDSAGVAGSSVVISHT